MGIKKINKIGEEGWFNPERLKEDVQSGYVESFSIMYHQSGSHRSHIDLRVNLSTGETRAYRLYNTDNKPQFEMEDREVRFWDGEKGVIINTRTGERRTTRSLDDLLG